MNGLMMDFPLTLQHFLELAGKLFPNKEIVTRAPAGMHRYCYRDYYRRTHRLAHVLEQLGVQPGDRVGTLVWNTHQHLELYFGITCYGAVLHTLNLRLSSDDLAFIIGHAEDRVIFVDRSLVPLLGKIRDRIPCVQKFVVIESGAPAGEFSAMDYEQLLAAAPDQPYSWPRLDENCAAGVCYTSGTTGNPKGVVYSHRALFLHSVSFAMADTFGLSERDVVLQVVPMFHANGWSLAFSAPMAGASMVMPGMKLDGASIYELLTAHKVTCTAAVPTIWIGLASVLQEA